MNGAVVETLPAIMPLPVKRKLTINQGATFRASWVWKPGGMAMDLTGCTARMQVRPERESPEVLLEMTTENGGITLGAVPGEIALYLGATNTASGVLDWESGVYDLEMQHPSGADEVTRFAEGVVVVRPEVTRV